MLSVLVSTHVLVAARDAGVERVFCASSACVCAADKQSSPDHPVAQRARRPAGHARGRLRLELFSERMARHFAEDFGIETRVARYHNVYGPEGTWDGGREKAPAAICRKVATAALTGDHTIEIWGDGQQTRSFTYIDDCLEGTLRLTASDVREPLNVGSDQLVTINELVDIVEHRRARPRAPLQARRPPGRAAQQRQHPRPRPAGLGAVGQPRGRPGRHLRLGARPGGVRLGPHLSGGGAGSRQPSPCPGHGRPGRFEPQQRRRVHDLRRPGAADRGLRGVRRRVPRLPAGAGRVAGGDRRAAAVALLGRRGRHTPSCWSPTCSGPRSRWRSSCCPLWPSPAWPWAARSARPCSAWPACCHW